MDEFSAIGRMSAAAALEMVERAQRDRRRAEVVMAVAMTRMVEDYRHDISTDRSPLGGEGTPEVDDFACLELAAALKRDADRVRAEVACLLDLVYRLPRIWAEVLDFSVPVWLATDVASRTRGLSLEEALRLDAAVGPQMSRLGRSRLLRLVDGLIVQASPGTDPNRRGRKVLVSAGLGQGFGSVYGVVDASDAIWLDASLQRLSGILAAQGSVESDEERRATALGILATPARALAMLQSAVQPALVDGSDGTEGTQPDRPADDGQPLGVATPTCTIGVDPEKLLPRAQVLVHISRETVEAGQGVARVERAGPVSVERMRTLLANARVTVRPVVDPSDAVPVDSYEIPERIRSAVLARHPFEVFPYSTRPAKGCDLDHTEPYRWGGGWSPGQTRVGNLGPLRRRSHRAKTHGGWRLEQPEPGWFFWTTPLGRRYLVTPTGLTIDLPRGSRVVRE